MLRIRLVGLALLTLVVFYPVLVFAELDSSLDSHLRDALFIVETDENAAAESLNRISGKIDTGFSSPQQSYKSENHRKRGPLSENQSPPY